MDVRETIVSRRSIRTFADTPVEEELLHRVLDSARLAPSGNNTQPWRFIVVRSRSQRENIEAVCNNQKWMLSAPVFIVCCADLSVRQKHSAETVIDETSPGKAVKQIIRDTAIAVEHLVLQAEACGLGTCWVGDFLQKDIRPVLGIPGNHYVVAVIPIGYAAETPSPRPRKPLDTLLFHESWGKTGPLA